MSASDRGPDEVIREALARDEAEGLESPGDPSTLALLTETFRGRNRLLAVGGVVANVAFLGVAVFALSRFLVTEDVREMLVWGGAGLLAVLLILAVKIWYWLEMVRLALTRDLKRLELRVSRLAERLDEPQEPT
ncbi:MAG: hypothetical protein P8170_08405 [Gemmatimonadota bacterium]